MADDSDAPNGSNRATVAQTLTELRGLRDLTRAEFANTQRQLDALTGLPVATTQLRADLEALKARVADIEGEDRSNSEWRRSHIPTFLLSGCILVLGIVELILNLH